MLTMSKNILSKEQITEKALKYDEQGDDGFKVPPSTAYAKGFREAIKMCTPFLMDSFRHRIEKLIK